MKNKQPKETLPANAGQMLADALRRHMGILSELAVRYEIETQPERPAGALPVVSCPEDVRLLLQPEMAVLAQEQMRVLLLDTKNRVVGQRVIYQGNISSLTIRTCRGVPPRRRGGRAPRHRRPQPPLGRPGTERRRTRPSRGSSQRRAGSWTSRSSTTWSSAAKEVVSLKERGVIPG